jgi:hypothetical protein
MRIKFVAEGGGGFFRCPKAIRSSTTDGSGFLDTHFTNEHEWKWIRGNSRSSRQPFAPHPASCHLLPHRMRRRNSSVFIRVYPWLIKGQSVNAGSPLH